jgi:transposase InsO family protein
MMTGYSIENASIEAISKTEVRPDVIQSDNGSYYISSEYRRFINSIDTDHQFIHSHCPNENGEIER